MTLTQAQQLLKLYNAGYNIYRLSCYVDSTMIVWEDMEGVIKYRSQVWAENPLEDIPVSQIKVSNPVENWEEL